MSDALKIVNFAVVGSGPAGLSAALALAHSGAQGVIAGPEPVLDPAHGDKRTTAIFNGAIALLQRLGVWRHCADAAAPLRAIRIIDDTGRLFRAPETLFEAREIGADAFGYNIANIDLVRALYAAVEEHDALTFMPTRAVTSVEPLADYVRLDLAAATTASAAAAAAATAPAAAAVGKDQAVDPAADRQIFARLVVGADGRRSIVRKAAKIAPYGWDYDQAAVVCSFAHSRSHEDVSTEFHRRGGPLTTVPLPGNWSSLVWVERKAQAKQLAALDQDAFAAELETQLGGLLGAIEDVSPRAHFPLSGMAARGLAANRIALIGEAAHVVPPIGAQGLNLGFRDGAALAECVGAALAQGRDPGAAQLLQDYAKARRVDVLSRTAAIDLLNRTLLSNMLPAQLFRGAGLHALNAVPMLKQLVMREGLQPGRDLPPLMRPIPPEALHST